MEKEANIVSSYFYYMWNCWCKEECKIVFADLDWDHFWSKWCAICQNLGVSGAAEVFWGELGISYRKKLIGRACEMYDGMCEKF